MTMNTIFARGFVFRQAAHGQDGNRRWQNCALKRTIVLTGWMLAALTLFVAPVATFGQSHGGGEGGGGGCGDVFGDLIHILRDADTGQPILAQRWVELPAEVQGYGWGYCPIAVYEEEGEQFEVPFLPYSCDLATDYLDRVVAVDYFGRLNGGRTKERNHRMHFDEVISNINQSERIQLDPTGRLMMGDSCVEGGDCLWSTIDSPMESMALYVRMMKYGHLGTDPYEVDTWAKGDPKMGPQFHPALTEADFAKLADAGLDFLLPRKNEKQCWDYNDTESFTDLNGNGVWDAAEPFIDINKDGLFNPVYPRPEPFTDLDGDGVWDDAEPFTDSNGNGVPDAFTYLCASPDSLDGEDFNFASVLLGAAANKTSIITVDLVQYLNRILKITQQTQHTEATLDTLPALYRDCWASAVDPLDPPEEGELVDPEYLDCNIYAADDTIPGYEYYPDVQERFMDFADSKYKRSDRADAKADLILEVEGSPGAWNLSVGTSLAEWVLIPNPADPAHKDVHNFVDAASDAVRAIEFFHNYAVPVDLYCVYDEDYCL